MSGNAKQGRRANDSRPLGTIEMLAQETERLRHLIPGELGNLKSTNSFSLVGDQTSDRKPELSRLNAANHSAWKVNGQGSIVRGLLGVDGKRLSQDEIADSGRAAPAPRLFRTAWAEA